MDYLYGKEKCMKYNQISIELSNSNSSYTSNLFILIAPFSFQTWFLIVTYSTIIITTIAIAARFFDIFCPCVKVFKNFHGKCDAVTLYPSYCAQFQYVCLSECYFFFFFFCLFFLFWFLRICFSRWKEEEEKKLMKYLAVCTFWSTIFTKNRFYLHHLCNYCGFFVLDQTTLCA